MKLSDRQRGANCVIVLFAGITLKASLGRIVPLKKIAKVSDRVPRPKASSISDGANSVNSAGALLALDVKHPIGEAIRPAKL